MICKKTLILQPTQLEAITDAMEYHVVDTDETGIYIINNQGDKHHFSQVDEKEYFH